MGIQFNTTQTPPGTVLSTLYYNIAKFYHEQMNLKTRPLQECVCESAQVQVPTW